MSIYFLRHGQTNWNKAGRWQGCSEVPLNETGLLQSQAVAECLFQEGANPLQVISSPRGRAQTTAQIVADKLCLEIAVEPDFAELELGEYEGKLTTDLERAYPVAFPAWLASYHQLAAPGGESLEAGLTRVRPQLMYWLDQAGRNDLVIVAHQAVNMVMKLCLANQPVENWKRSVLRSYKQSNSQIDIWSTTRPHHFLRRIEAEYGC